MHGYIDSFPVPMHLPSASAPAKSAKGKGKAQDPGAGKATPYDVVASWTAHERDDVERKVAMASLCASFRSLPVGARRTQLG